MQNEQNNLYIGLMSGTSADGIDLALVDFSSGKPKLIASYYQAYDSPTHQAITSLYAPSANELDKAFSLDKQLAQLFAGAINNFIKEQGLSANDIVAIGNHGQTIRHRPSETSDITCPFTLQIGCCQTLASLTGIRVVGQFRQKDMIYGGQGAPLVPAFHRALIPKENNDVFVVNIGGIANITFLPESAKKDIIGFDTGPGNALLDAWYQQHCQGRYDEGGNWAASGKIQDDLLTSFLSDEYFKQPPPKSTGREYFTPEWISQHLKNTRLEARDIQATLTALTAITIANDIMQLSTKSNVYICGGGAQNEYLLELLKQELIEHSIQKIEQISLDHDTIESMAFAWFAFAFDKNIFGNIPAVTGASRSLILGTAFNP